MWRPEGLGDDRLTAAIVGWLDRPRPEAIAAAVEGWEEVDWRAAQGVLFAQGIGPYLRDAVRAVGAGELLAPSLREWLEREYAANARRMALMHAELAAILAGAGRLGIAVLPLKGSVLSVRHYATPALRPMADLDLLVRPDAEAGLAEVLTRLGYRLQPGEAGEHRTYLQPGQGVASWEVDHPDNPRPVELHTGLRRLLWLGRDGPDLAEALWREGCEAEHLGQRAWLPSDAVLLADLAQHAMRHALMRTGRVLHWLDLAQVAAGLEGPTVPAADWAYPPLRLAARAFPSRFEGFALEPLAARTAPRLRRLAETVPLDGRAGLNVAAVNPALLSRRARRWRRWQPTTWRATFAFPALPRVPAHTAYLGIVLVQLARKMAHGQRPAPAGGALPAPARAGALRVVLVNYAYDPTLAAPEALLERYETLVGWAEGLVRAGLEVAVVQRFSRDARLDRGGVEFRFVRDGLGPVPRSWHVPLRAHRWVVGLEPEVVHVNGFGFPLALRALRASLPSGAALVAQHHGGLPKPGPRGALQRWGLDAADGLLFAADGLATPWLGPRAAAPPRAFEVMEGSTHFVPRPREAARARTGMHGRPVLLWVGHLDANKDPLTVLAGFQALLLDVPEARLYLAYGRTDLLTAVRARLACAPPLAAAVTLLGHVPHDELVWHYSSADYFVSGSHREGSGYALAEALCCGAVPIVTDIPSFRMMSDGGRIGALWPAGDAAGFCRAASAVLARSHGDQARAARAHFAARLSFDAIGRRAADLYRTVAERRTG